MVDNLDESYITPEDQENLSVKFATIDALLEEERYKHAKNLLQELHHADLAAYLDNCTSEQKSKTIEILGADFDPETLVWVDDSVKNSIAKMIGVLKLSKLIEQLETEDGIEVIEDLNDDVRDLVIELLPKSIQKEIKEGFSYPENSAGRVMERKFLQFPQHWTVGQAMDSIRRRKDVPNSIYASIVVDSAGKPVGTIMLSTLVKSKQDVPIKTLMDDEFKIAESDTDREELSYVFKHYALTIVPVVSKNGKLIGTVSIDNMVYIIDEEAEEDIMHLGGLNERDLYDSLVNTAHQRFPWLFVNLVTACITAIVISLFEGTIAQKVTLALIMPIVASMGGNAGTQTVTLAVRSIASKDINDSNSTWLIIKETLVCGLNGVLLSLVGGLITFMLFFDLHLSIIFGAAVIINFLVAGFLGSTIPIFLNKIDIDPAVASGVILTALTDTIGFFVFLGLAYLFLI